MFLERLYTTGKEKCRLCLCLEPHFVDGFLDIGWRFALGLGIRELAPFTTGSLP